MIRRSDNEFQDICTTFGLMTLTWAWAERDRVPYVPDNWHPEHP